jgi:hypothetical protein
MTPTNTQTRTQPVTPTQTQTQTPSPTPCYEPKAYILFDSQTGSTALNTWMASQGSAFRGMFINGPSTVPATFEAQMNAYISYSGFGSSQYYALAPQNITPNQDPIVWPEGAGPAWGGTFVWTNMFVPTCPICPNGEYGLMGANGTAIHTTNDVRRSIPFYYSGTAIPTGYYRLYTTYSATDMRLGSSGTQYILGSLDCGITPTPSPTKTSTATPTNTATPSTTPTSPCNTNWTIRNADCGLGTVNDIGINGSFMNTLSGPSTFPLTSTLYGTKSNPNGVICGAGNLIQANITTNIAGTGNCAFMEIIINGVQTNILYFTSNPFPQISGVVINSGDNVEVRIGCFLGPCPEIPVTPTQTQTPSPTIACPNTIYTHGAIRATCSDFCTTNYLIGTTNCASETYFNLSIGDFIYGYAGQNGYIAYSNVSTDTNTGPFRIAEIDGTGEVLGLYVCSGGSCIPL